MIENFDVFFLDLLISLLLFPSKLSVFNTSVQSEFRFLHQSIFITPFICARHDFHFRLNFLAVMKFRAKLKTTPLATFLLCRDITLLVTTSSTFGGTSHPLAATLNISSMCYDVATTSSQRNLLLSRPLLFLPSILTESRNQSLLRPSQYLPQFTEQIAFHSLSNLKSSASNKSNLHNNSHTFLFTSHIIYIRKRMLPCFP